MRPGFQSFRAVSKLESHARFSASDSTEFRAELLAHRAGRRGCPEVILNRRRDVRECEIFSEIGPFEAKDTEDVLSDLDRVAPGRGMRASMAIAANSIERTQIVVVEPG